MGSVTARLVPMGAASVVGLVDGFITAVPVTSSGETLQGAWAPAADAWRLLALIAPAVAELAGVGSPNVNYGVMCGASGLIGNRVGNVVVPPGGASGIFSDIAPDVEAGHVAACTGCAGGAAHLHAAPLVAPTLAPAMTQWEGGTARGLMI